jgi:hypothetical protein
MQESRPPQEFHAAGVGAGDAADSGSRSPHPPKGPPTKAALAVFALLLLAYLSSGDFLVGNDATGNVRLALQLLTKGKLTFTEEESPQMFVYRLKLPTGDVPVRIRSWDETLEGRTAREWRQLGLLTLQSPYYYLTPAKTPGSYTNAFGLGAGALAFPAFATAKLLAPAFENQPDLIWQLSKAVASVAVAASAVFVFAAATEYVGTLSALLLALAYGLCTCVWSTSSQTLWQHGPAELFLAMGTFFLVRSRPSPFLSGLAYSAAVACRPTCFLVLFAACAFLGWRDNRAFLRFCVGALPVGALLVIYAWTVLGNPFSSAQLAVAGKIALAKTGNPNVWQTPLYLGLPGLLFSPGRGLLVYSPVALFGILGSIQVWRDRKWTSWRPLTLAVVGMLLLASLWFDWWGGWCYGYRPVVDVAPLLAFLTIPAVPWLAARRWRRLTCLGLCLWSFGVQLLGAYCYDFGGWNARRLFAAVAPDGVAREYFDESEAAQRRARGLGGTVEVVKQNIDLPAYRPRLWSITDSPIVYYATHPLASHRARAQWIATFLRNDW